ncbi:MAG: hypothetical protein HY673_15680 [Chloroflexi bacterium]|nr:hypothetical protein [Chloroflexota bacterium]
MPLQPTLIQAPSFAHPVFALGDPGILQGKKLAFFCSVKCPGEPIVRAYDFARAMRDAGIVVISGFQSPIEKDCLDLLLRGSQPVIICPARSLHGMRLTAAWKTAVEQGRLLLLSPFAEGIRRPTIELSEKRNEFVANLADQVLFAHANPGGKTEALAMKLINSGKPVLTFDSKENANLVALGAKPIRADQIVTESGR